MIYGNDFLLYIRNVVASNSVILTIVLSLFYGGKISTFHQKPSIQFLVYKTMQLLLWFIQLIYIY